MASNPFTWGATGEHLSPSRVKKYADIAAALAANNSAPTTLGAGLSRVGDALLHNSYEAKAADGEAEGAASRKAVIDALMANPDPSMTDIAGAMGNEWVASDPGSQAVVQALMGQENQQQDWARQDSLRADDRAYDAPMRELQLQSGQQGLDKGALELDALRNPPPAAIPDSVQALDLRAQRAGLQPGTPEYNDFMIAGGAGKGQTINVGGNNDIGTIPAGKMVTRDAAGNITGMVDIPGGPSAEAAAVAAAAADAKSTQSSRYGNVVVEDIDRAVSALEKDPTWTTGILGQAMGNFKGSGADRLNNLLDTVKANAGFDRLQAMRDASPTGGALGAVSEQENKLLQSAIGSLETSNADDLVYNLKRVQSIYNDIVNGPASAPASPSASDPPGAPPEGVDASLWGAMTAEERALWP